MQFYGEREKNIHKCTKSYQHLLITLSKVSTRTANKKETNFFEIYGYFVRIFKMNVV